MDSLERNGAALDAGFSFVTDSQNSGDEGKAAGRLSLEQGVELISRLARDDEFRTRFENDPMAAMLEAGVDPGVCATLKRSCCEAKPLASKEVYASLLDDIGGTAFMAAMEFNTPQIG